MRLALGAGCSFVCPPQGLFGWVETGVDTEALAQTLLREGDIPPAVIPKHGQWVPDRLNFFVVAYNPNKVKAADLPALFDRHAAQAGTNDPLALIQYLDMKTYLVGGAVRDTLLGRPYTECDYVVVGAVPDFFFRSNTRNLKIIKKHLDKHHPGTRIIES